MAFQTKTIFSMLYKAIFDIILYTLIVATVLALLPTHLFTNFPIEPASYEADIPESLPDWNNLLAERSELLNNEVIVGPESLTENNGFLYTGLADGRLVEIDKKTNKIRDITRFGTRKDCGNNEKILIILNLINLISSYET